MVIRHAERADDPDSGEHVASGDILIDYDC